MATVIKGRNFRLTVRPKCPPLVLTFTRKRGVFTGVWRWHFTLAAEGLRRHWMADEGISWWHGWRKIQRNADHLRARWRRDHPGEVLHGIGDSWSSPSWDDL